MDRHSRTQRVNPHTRTQRLGHRRDDALRKKLRSAGIMVLLVIAGIAVYRSDLLGKFGQVEEALETARTPHDSVAARAAELKDVPHCRKYRAAILAQEGKRGDDAAAAIAEAYNDARNDRCLKFDDIQ
jgi:hypothetical protein